MLYKFRFLSLVMELRVTGTTLFGVHHNEFLRIVFSYELTLTTCDYKTINIPDKMYCKLVMGRYKDFDMITIRYLPNIVIPIFPVDSL